MNSKIAFTKMARIFLNRYHTQWNIISENSFGIIKITDSFLDWILTANYIAFGEIWLVYLPAANDVTTLSGAFTKVVRWWSSLFTWLHWAQHTSQRRGTKPLLVMEGQCREGTWYPSPHRTKLFILIELQIKVRLSKLVKLFCYGPGFISK